MGVTSRELYTGADPGLSNRGGRNRCVYITSSNRQVPYGRDPGPALGP